MCALDTIIPNPLSRFLWVFNAPYSSFQKGTMPDCFKFSCIPLDNDTSF